MTWTKTRSLIALAKKADPDADVSDLRRQMKAEWLEEYLQRTADSDPPLNESQRIRLAQLLTNGADPLASR